MALFEMSDFDLAMSLIRQDGVPMAAGVNSRLWAWMVQLRGPVLRGKTFAPGRGRSHIARAGRREALPRPFASFRVTIEGPWKSCRFPFIPTGAMIRQLKRSPAIPRGHTETQIGGNTLG